MLLGGARPAETDRTDAAGHGAAANGDASEGHRRLPIQTGRKLRDPMFRSVVGTLTHRAVDAWQAILAVPRGGPTLGGVSNFVLST
jgi:hypothetical protein